MKSDSLALRAVLYRPSGRGPFPGVLFSHGSGHASGVGADGLADQRHPELLGPVFARHGYAFLYLYRRGEGLSRGQGEAAADIMDKELAEHGQTARNAVQIRLLDDGDQSDAVAGLAFLRTLPDVDPRRIAVAGHSFGGSLTLLLAARDTSLRAAVLFSGSGLSWDRSSELRARLRAAADNVHAPVFFIHAANDFSTAPGESLGVEMGRAGRPHRVKIYPAVGHTPADGHDFIHLAIASWESDVFDFLDPLMKK
ncbi:MAG TPA: dienelactone hydrolase family protein [Candidatus Udaeobacter sp.]|nr:dienelactone hydrolase family protein [Candidatus Udaeobacter sp.]